MKNYLRRFFEDESGAELIQLGGNGNGGGSGEITP